MNKTSKVCVDFLVGMKKVVPRNTDMLGSIQKFGSCNYHMRIFQHVILGPVYTGSDPNGSVPKV